MKKRICIIKNGYFDNPRVFRDANTLSGAGYQVDVICMKKGSEQLFEKMNNINICRIPINHHRGNTFTYILEYSLFLLFAFILVSILFIKRKYPVIEVINVPDFLVFAAVIPKIFGSKIILAMSEPTPELYFALGKKSQMIKKTLKFLQVISCKFSDVILPVTQAMKDYLIKLNIPEKKLIVILNVPDDTIYNFKTSVNNGNNTFRLIYSGSILQRFGVETLVKSLQHLVPKIPNILLDIYGTGEHLKKTETLVIKLKLEKYVKFHGYIKLHKVPEVIRNTNICVVPILKNSYSELVQTHKMYESIACKKPVVISRINSFLECFKEDQLCYFESGNEKDLAKCIFELYKNPDRQEKNVEEAFCQFQNYKWQVTKELFINMIDKMSNNGQRNN